MKEISMISKQSKLSVKETERSGTKHLAHRFKSVPFWGQDLIAVKVMISRMD